MKKLSKVLFRGLIGYSLLLGTIFFLLCTNCAFLSLVETAVETRMNPLRILAWLAVIIGS